MAKFKVGDRVRCINVGIYTSQLDRVHGHGWHKGKEFKIIEISNIPGERCSDNSLPMPLYWYQDNYRVGVYEHALELVESVKSNIKPYGICAFVNKYYK